MLARPMPRSTVLALALSSAAVVGPALGCRPPGPSDVVSTETRNPNGLTAAYVVTRSAGSPAAGHTSYVIILPDAQSPLNQGPELPSIAAFAARDVDGLRLSWTTADQLEVLCDGCDLKPSNISQQLDHLGAVKVSYVGFPGHHS